MLFVARRVVSSMVVGYSEKVANWWRMLMDTAQKRYTIEMTYRNVFGLCSPSIIDFPKEAICELGLNALMRGSPVTDAELRAWIDKNSLPTKP